MFVYELSGCGFESRCSHLTIRSDLTDYAKKVEVATDITTIKNNYVSNASLTSRLNDLKSQHIATEVTGIDNKTKKMLVIF